MTCGGHCSDRAITSTAGVVLLLGVAVLLSVLLAVFVFQLGQPDLPPQAAVTVDQDGNEADYLSYQQEAAIQLISIDNAEKVIVRPATETGNTCNGERTLTDDDRLAEYVHCSVGDQFAVVAVSGDDEELVSSFELRRG